MENTELVSQTFHKFSSGNIRDTFEILLQCNIQDESNGIEADIEFTVDTGASGVVMNAADLGIKESEISFVTRLGLKSEIHVGVAKHYKIVNYVYIAPKFTFGKFVLTDFPIRITFDPNAPYPLLGMSLLRLFFIELNPITEEITFTETPRLAEYTHTNKSMRDIDTVPLEDYLDFHDEQILEANYINQLIKNS